MNLRDILYAFASLSFAVVIGAAVYEHLAVVPRWAAAPPVSLSMFQGPYGLNPGIFWQMIHPVTLLLMIFSLVVFWKASRKKNIVITLISYVIILIITAIYFVPELLEITGTPYSKIVDEALIKRAKLWEVLSIIRMFILIALSIIFFLGLTKPSLKQSSTKNI